MLSDPSKQTPALADTLQELLDLRDSGRVRFYYSGTILSEMAPLDPAYASGEVVQMDSVYISTEPVKVHVLLDLHGYTIVPNGRNEAIINDITNKVSITSETITKEEFTFNIKSGFENPDIYVEFYLTLEHPDTPGLYIIKRAYLDFAVLPDEKAEKVQEQVYSLTLLPY